MRRRTIELSWGPVSYLEWGAPGEAGTVVLLHGGGFDSAALSWASLGPALAAAGHHVLAPDHPGYGQSPPAPWASTVQNLSGYVGEFLDRLAVGPGVVGGLSLGGVLALLQALQRPEATRALVLLAPYGIMRSQYTGPFASALQALTWLSVRTGLLDAVTRWYARDRRLMEGSVRALVRNPRALTPALVDEVMAAAGRPGAWIPFSQFQHREVLWNRLRTDLTGRLHEVRVPTLFVQGSADTGVPVARARRAAALVPDADLLVVEGAGHWVQRDRPDVVDPAVVAFLAALRRPER